jgi:hypothetical protein
VNNAIVRLVASPPLPPHTLDDAAAALASVASVLAASNDHDVNASALSVAVDAGRIDAACDAIAARVGMGLAAGRAFRFDIMLADPGALADEPIRSLAVRLHGAFGSPVYLARRDKPAAAWAFDRPMPWGRKGLAVGQAAPMLPFGGSDCLGVAIELTRPTLVLKARLDDVPEHGLVQACAAVGGADSGFAEVGAYPAVSAADGASVVVLEFGDVARSPMRRTLDVLDIEARRFGGRLGSTALLSHVPLDALLDTLAAQTGLAAAPAHVLETHLPDERAR